MSYVQFTALKCISEPIIFAQVENYFQFLHFIFLKMEISKFTGMISGMRRKEVE